MAADAFAFSVVMTSTAAFTWESVAFSRLMAVVMIPKPSGLVRNRAAPAGAVEFRTIRSTGTNPMATMPYLGSGSVMEWPPTMATPASPAMSCPPCITRASSSSGRSSTGQLVRFRAMTG